MTVAATILDQIKTIDPMAMMAWGAKNVSRHSTGLTFKTSGLVKWKGNVDINYNESTDLYDLDFGKMRKFEWVVSHTAKDVFAEDLVSVIDSIVG